MTINQILILIIVFILGVGVGCFIILLLWRNQAKKVKRSSLDSLYDLKTLNLKTLDLNKMYPELVVKNPLYGIIDSDPLYTKCLKQHLFEHDSDYRKLYEAQYQQRPKTASEVVEEGKRIHEENQRIKNTADEIIKIHNVDIEGIKECKNVDEYNYKYGTYKRAKNCKKLGTEFCNKDCSMKNFDWIGCEETCLSEEEFGLLKFAYIGGYLRNATRK